MLRRTDKYGAGLFTTNTIEKVRNEEHKSTGGLTTGREMGESQRAVWLLFVPATSCVHCSMQTSSGFQ
jgi:hypothetical protein